MILRVAFATTFLHHSMDLFANAPLVGFLTTSLAPMWTAASIILAERTGPASMPLLLTPARHATVPWVILTMMVFATILTVVLIMTTAAQLAEIVAVPVSTSLLLELVTRVSVPRDTIFRAHGVLSSLVPRTQHLLLVMLSVGEVLNIKSNAQLSAPLATLVRPLLLPVRPVEAGPLQLDALLEVVQLHPKQATHLTLVVVRMKPPVLLHVPRGIWVLRGALRALLMERGLLPPDAPS